MQRMYPLYGLDKSAQIPLRLKVMSSVASFLRYRRKRIFFNKYLIPLYG
jgi:hypothetical protein